LKTAYSYREIDLHPDIAQFLKQYMGERNGLLFPTRNGTPHMHHNLEEDWLTPRLKAMGVNELGMGWHIFRRFRQSWLRDNRCHPDISLFWMGHAASTMCELYGSIRQYANIDQMEFKFGQVKRRLEEAQSVGFGFDLPKNLPENVLIAPIAPKFSV